MCLRENDNEWMQNRGLDMASKFDRITKCFWQFRHSFCIGFLNFHTLLAQRTDGKEKGENDYEPQLEQTVCTGS